MEKVFITGASGYVGLNLLEKISSSDKYEIYGLARDSEKLDYLKDRLDIKNFYSIEITNHNEVKKKLEEIKPNIIVHLAATGFNPQKTIAFDDLLKVNYEATYKFADIAQTNKVEKFVYLTTYMECQGSNKALLADELIVPQTKYALSKSLATNHLLFIARTLNFPISILRLFSVYGKKDLPFRFIPQIFETFKNNTILETTSLKQKRDFIFISDVIDAIEATFTLQIQSKKGRHKSPIFNVGSGKPTELYKVYEKIKKQFPESKAQIKIGAKSDRVNEEMCYFADIEKSKKMLKWRPKISLDEGIEITARQYNNER